MRSPNWIRVWILAFLVFCPFDMGSAGEDPGIPDTVRLEGWIPSVRGSPCQTRATLPLSVYNDEYVYQMTILLKWTGPLVGDSARSAGERVNWDYFEFWNLDKFAIVALGLVPPGEGIIAELHFSIPDTGFVAVDSLTHVTPGGWDFGFVDSLYNWFVPEFVGLETDIFRCPPGDFNQSGDVDVADVISLSNYLFLGAAPPDFVISGDVNRDCVVDIGDVVYLINYLFIQGPCPQVGCTF